MTMRFAVLCDDPLTNPLVATLCDRVDGHQLVHAVRRKAGADGLPACHESISYVEHWEDLLVAKDVDAVVVGGSDPTILDGAKQLAGTRIPILFSAQAAQGSTFVYELGLIRDDNQVLLFPLFWHRFDLAVIELKKALIAGQLGRIQYLQLSRGLSRPSTNDVISQAAVDAELLHDVDLLRWLTGDYDQVTALRTAATNQGVLMQNVVLAGRSMPEANWSIRPVEGLDEWCLSVRGECGNAELHRDGSARCWVCEIDGRRVEGDERSTAQGVLAAFQSATTDGHLNRSTSRRMNGCEWSDLVKCFETVDATHRSVRRRRTIELLFEPMSERAIFKTQMTAMGCGLLVATFFLLLLYLAVASFVDPVNHEIATSNAKIDRPVGIESNALDNAIGQKPLPLAHRVMFGLRLLVFAPLVIFLVAQILLPLTRPSSNEPVPSKDDACFENPTPTA